MLPLTACRAPAPVRVPLLMRRAAAARLRGPTRPCMVPALALRQQPPRGVRFAGTAPGAAGAPALSTPLSCICDVMIVPAGVGPSFSKHVAACVQGFEDNPELKVQIHPMGTCLEGEWMEVMGAVKKATLQLHSSGIARVTSTLKVGTRVDKQGYDMAYKLSRIQEQLENLASRHPANARDERALLEQLTALLPDLNVAMAAARAHKGEAWDPQPLTDRIKDVVHERAKDMPLGSTTGGMELNLNQTGVQLGDPTYDENDEETWQQIAKRARKPTPTGQQPSAAASVAGLHEAASGGGVGAVVALLKQPGAIGRIDDLDEGPGTTGMTALHWAAKNGHTGVCEALLKEGASSAVRDQFGRTALDLAQRYGHGSVVELLTGVDL